MESIRYMVLWTSRQLTFAPLSARINIPLAIQAAASLFLIIQSTLNEKSMKPVFPILIIGLILASCAPKSVGRSTTDTAPAPQTEPVAEQGNVRQDPTCTTFADSKFPEDAMNAHAVYRTFLRSGDMESAFPNWQKAFEWAPAADGKRAFQYTDGVRFYKEFFAKAADADTKAAHVKKIRELYEAGIHCYPKEYYLNGMYAFDLYYSFREYSNDKEIYELFKKNIDLEGERTGAFVLNPFTDVLIRRYLAGEISTDEAQAYDRKIREILAYGLAGTKDVESFQVVASYAPIRLEELETIEGFYPPAYYADRYYPVYLADSTNCETVQTVYSRFRWGKVDAADPRVVALTAKVNGPCRVVETASQAREALDALQSGRYRDAIKGFESAAEETTDADRKARYYQLIAKIYYAHLKNFPNARTYALKAAKYKEKWGEPYLLIGRLYASSGPLCGPGRGWDSQVVTWPAIDKWQYARSIDPDAAAEANRLISQYTAFMPSVEDVFQRNLAEGSTYFVGCWIQESTRIRAAK